MSNNNFDKVFVNFSAPDAFQLCRKILGDNNANFNYVFQETKAKCNLRGRGSGFIEANGTESNEMLHIFIEFADFKSRNEAKTLAQNLIETVQSDLQSYLQQQQSQQQNIGQQIMQQTNQQQHITIPQGIHTFSVPPPTMIQQQPTQIIQQQNFVPQILQQQPNVSTMQIMQAPMHIPPPIRTTAPMVQFQTQPANIIQQGTTATGQQILFNHTPTQQYQLQYIQPSGTNPQIQTIQHLIQQPTQPIQGIIQQNPNEQQFITVQGNGTSYTVFPPQIQQVAPHQIFNTQQTITINPEDMKSDPLKSKNDVNSEVKTNLSQQQISRIVTVPPPTVMSCPPPQVFNQQQIPVQQSVQQIILNPSAQSWSTSQQQHIQTLPMNSTIQILSQPQAMLRNGNEIIIQQQHQNTGMPQQQQIFATFNPQQAATHQQFQQIQVQQSSAITQSTSSAPNPSQVTQTQPMTFQQQFEMKINASEIHQQQRVVKRKLDGDNSKAFPKTGMGSNHSKVMEMSKNKSRMASANQQQNSPTSTFQQIRPSTSIGNSFDSNKKNQNQSQGPNFRNTVSSAASSTADTMKNVVGTSSTAEIKTIGNPQPGNTSEPLNTTIQFYPQQNQNQMGFIMRGTTNNQNIRFQQQSPQSFIHQQPPPTISHNSSFGGTRGQIMSNASMGIGNNISMYQPTSSTLPTAGQTTIHMMQPPLSTGSVVTTQQFITTTSGQQDIANMGNVYQQNSNFMSNPSHGNYKPHQMTMTATSAANSIQPVAQQQPPGVGNNIVSGMISVGNYQQQQQQPTPRFRQW